MDDKTEITKESELGEDVAVTIGKNIMRLRRMSNMTQLELAERLNYSDKSISKWEQGNGIPDVRILMQLAQLFSVSLDDLVREHPEGKVMPRKARQFKRIIITLLSSGLCWVAAVVCFVLIGIFAPGTDYSWLAFVYAVAANSIVVLVFSCIWRWLLARVLSVSVLIWTTLACIFLTTLAFGPNIWYVFLIGAALQPLAIFLFVWWKRSRFFQG